MNTAQTIDSLVRHLADLNNFQANIAFLFGLFVVSIIASVIILTLMMTFAYRRAKLSSSERQETMKIALRITELNTTTALQVAAEARQLSADFRRTSGLVNDTLQATRFLQDQVAVIQDNAVQNPRRRDGESPYNYESPLSYNAGDAESLSSPDIRFDAEST